MQKSGKKPASDVGSPEYRAVFGCLNDLLDAVEKLNAAHEREVTTEDEMGYSIGRFMRTIVAKRDDEKIHRIMIGFRRGIYGEDTDE